MASDLELTKTWFQHLHSSRLLRERATLEQEVGGAYGCYRRAARSLYPPLVLFLRLRDLRKKRQKSRALGLQPGLFLRVSTRNSIPDPAVLPGLRPGRTARHFASVARASVVDMHQRERTATNQCRISRRDARDT